MYENRHGRFTAIDPLLASGKSANPQTFNRYVYVMNNPLIFTDPSGMQINTNPQINTNEAVEEDPTPIVIRTAICDSFWCKMRRGFNQLVRSIIGSDNPYQDEEQAYQERKRTGSDKQVGNAVKNYTNDVDKVTNAVVEVEPTGIGLVTKVTVKNSVGEATDMELVGAYGNLTINTVLAILPGGKGAKVAVSRVSGWVERKIFNGLDEAIKKKVVAAIQKGIVGPTGEQGIIKLSESEAKKTGYTHKIKILGKGGDIRIYGRQGENGHIIFDTIDRH
jgi:hypothetical protein